MLRHRTVLRLIAATGLLALTVPGAVSHSAPVAAAPPRRPVLAVPRAMLRSPAVPVIVEMTSANAGALLNRAPGLADLFARVRENLLSALHADKASNIYAYHLIPAVAATVPGAALPALLQQPGVGAIVMDNWHALSPIPDLESLRATEAVTGTPTGPRIDVPQTIEPESYTLTRADVARANGYTGAGVRVAVIDSGLDITQPDLSNVVARDASGQPLRVDFTGTDLQDTVGHGTACASVIAAQGRVLYTGDNSAPLQVYPQPSNPVPLYRSHFHMYGMAPNVRILSAKIFDSRVPNGGGYDSWIVRAIEWAVDNHADVISESFGGLSVPSNGTDPTALADEAAVQAGVTVVAADGNAGPGQGTIGSPASAPGVIGVGASTDFRGFGQTGLLATFGRTTADNIAAFTSLGPTTDGRPRPDLVAPGAFTWGLFPVKKSEDGPTKPPYDVGIWGGTSTATPVTAGAAALVIEAFRKSHHGITPSPALVRSILMSSAHDLGFPAAEQGSGRVDAWKAIQTAVHNGPSFLIDPNSVALAGPVAAPFSTVLTITNTGSTTQQFSAAATLSHQTGVRTWSGTVHGIEAHAYHFTVAPGLERIVGAVYWNSADRFVVGGVTKEVAMRVALYDPQGRFTNYNFGSATGYASTQVAHPMPGTWTLVVTENGRAKVVGGTRHYTKEDYTARMMTFVTVPFGRLSPASITVAPGQSGHIALSGARPRQAGVQVVSVRVTGDHTVVVPVAVTSYITLRGDGADFSGVFTGGADGYISLTNENKTYSLNVPPGTGLLGVTLSWPDPGYGIYLLLLDPSGAVVDAQFNGIGSGVNNSPLDLRLHNLDAIWSNPVPGRWQIMVMEITFSGKQREEPFSGRVTFNDTPVTPAAVTQTVLPGGSFAVTLNVRNHNGPNVAEGYYAYATSDSYSRIPLGLVHSTLGNVGVAGSNIFTYTTGFVPPGTRMVASSIAAVHPGVPIDLSFNEPFGFVRAEGQPAPVSYHGQSYAGTTALVTGQNLPIGPWSGEVTLQRPVDGQAHPLLIGSSYADALTPLSWVTFDHDYLTTNGRLVGENLLILLPRQQDIIRASVTVPLSAAPGAYHGHLFVYTLYGDQVADVPLTINVQAQVGAEPAK